MPASDSSLHSAPGAPAATDDPSELLPDAAAARVALEAAGWSPGALAELLGPSAQDHLLRGEHAPLEDRLAGRQGPLVTWARLCVLGQDVPADQAAAAGVPDGWLRVAPGGQVRARLHLQAVEHGGARVTVPHDVPARSAGGPGPGALRRAQVLGVGAASVTLAAATPRTPVGRALDVGTGSGVQALLLHEHAEQVVATDLHPRAVGWVRVAAALGGADLDVRQGSLLEPVGDGEVFDLVVSNPPFVIGPEGRFEHRDGGLAQVPGGVGAGDGVCEALLRGVPGVLAPGGHAVLLASWLHRAGEDGDERVLSWLRGSGCDARVVQREVAAPEDYVTAWLRDGGEGGADGAFDERWRSWTGWLRAGGVEAVAFGVVTIRRPRVARRDPVVLLEDVPQPVAPGWGEEVVGWFERQDLLATDDLLAAALTLRPDVRLVQVGAASGGPAGDEGWEVLSQRLQQEAGLRWSGGVDEHGAALLAGCDGRAPLGTLVALLAQALDEPVGEVAAQVLPVVRALVAQGFLTGAVPGG